MSRKSGALLEEQVYQYLRHTIVPHLLSLSPERNSVYRKRRYYSSLRQGYIETDVSIELTLKGAAGPFLIWVWECKDYAHPVPVDDVEEFDSKLSQIGEHNTKGTIVSRSGFQRSAVTLAKAKGIGLARMEGPAMILIAHAGEPNYEGEAFGTLLQSPREHDGHFAAIRPNGEFVRLSTFTQYIAVELFLLLPKRFANECRTCGRRNVRSLLYSEQLRCKQETEKALLFKAYPICRRCNMLFRALTSPLFFIPSKYALLVNYWSICGATLILYLTKVNLLISLLVLAVFLLIYKIGVSSLLRYVMGGLRLELSVSSTLSAFVIKREVARALCTQELTEEWSLLSIRAKLVEIDESKQSANDLDWKALRHFF